MNCDFCDKEVSKHFFVCVCKDCIRPGSVEAVLKQRNDKIDALNRIISEQQIEINKFIKKERLDVNSKNKSNQ